MNRRFNRTQRNYIIAGLCMILVIMGVGYAAFSSQLKISGTSNISGSFNIQITNIVTILPSQLGDGVPDGYNISEPTYTPSSATFSAGFELPGSAIAYIVEVSNLGSIDGQVGIGNLSCGDNSAIMCQAMATDEEGANGINFDYGNQDYSYINFPLKTGEKHYIWIIVHYADVTEQPTDLDTNIKLDLTYEQYKDPNVPIPSGETTLIGGQEVDLVSGGDGLYKDEYENGRYVYKGANPNNYITFNNEMWRILSIEADGRIKIVRDELLSSRAFDSTISNQWDRPSDIKTYLNGEYLESITVNKEKIVSSTWSIGAVTWNNNDLAGQIASENVTQSQTASVGLITASEYLRANPNKELCGNFSLNNDNYSTCQTTNWLFKNNYYWTISPYSGNSYLVFYVYRNGGVRHSTANGTNAVLPAITLSSDISLSGSGEAANPFLIN